MTDQELKAAITAKLALMDDMRWWDLMDAMNNWSSRGDNEVIADIIVDGERKVKHDH